MVVVADARVAFGHWDVEDENGAAEVEDGNEYEGPVGADEGDDDAECDGSDKFSEFVGEGEHRVCACRHAGLDDVLEECDEGRPCECNGEPCE